MNEVLVPNGAAQIIVAMGFAKMHHEGQIRKYTFEPYMVHPFAVAGLVMSVTKDSEMIQAAFLHDTVEDTNATISDINTIFGSRVGTLVEWLTNTTTKADGNRTSRKLINQRRLEMAPPEAKTIKLADIIVNIQSIMCFDPGFAKTYMAEKRDTVAILQQGDPLLLKVATDIVKEYYTKHPRVLLGEIHENSNAQLSGASRL